MAKNNFKKLTPIKDTEDGGFGSYEEHNGGGSPKGGVWGGKSGRVGWEERKQAGEVKGSEHREDQPRDKEGHFTYNSVNGKETKYESRGKTVNPLLTGGDGTIHIDEAKKQFAEKKGSLYDKYKDKWYQKGDKLITKEGKKYVVKVSENDVWEIARVSFDINKGAFNYEKENFDKTKAGRHSKDEKAAMQAAKQNKAATFVKNPAGGIQGVKNAQPGQQLSTGIPFQLNPAIISKFRKMQAIQAMGAPGAGTATFGTPAPANGPATTLVQNQKSSFAVNPNILSNLAGIVSQYTAQPVPMAPQQQKPKVSLAGFAGFKK